MRQSQKRFGVTLVAAMAFTLIGLHGVSAQDQSNFFADADGIEPPDIGVAYELPVTAVAATTPSAEWPELTALLFDADGMEPPDCGFAYDNAAAYKAFAERRRGTNRVVVRTGENR